VTTAREAIDSIRRLSWFVVSIDFVEDPGDHVLRAFLVRRGGEAALVSRAFDARKGMTSWSKWLEDPPIVVPPGQEVFVRVKFPDERLIRIARSLTAQSSMGPLRVEVAAT